VLSGELETVLIDLPDQCHGFVFQSAFLSRSSAVTFGASAKISAIRVISGKVLCLSVAGLFVLFPQPFK